MLLANLPKANLPNLNSREDAATAVNVSGRLIEAASKVQRNGTSELVGMVNKGELAVSAAAEIAGLSPADQVVAVADGPKAAKEKAAAIRNGKARSRTSTVESPEPFPDYENASQDDDSPGTVEAQAESHPGGEARNGTVATLSPPPRSTLWDEDDEPEPDATDDPTPEIEPSPEEVEKWVGRWEIIADRISRFMRSVVKHGGRR